MAGGTQFKLLFRITREWKSKQQETKLKVYFDRVFLVFTQACRCSNKIQLTWTEHSFSEALRTILVLNYLEFWNTSQTWDSLRLGPRLSVKFTCFMCAFDTCLKWSQTVVNTVPTFRRLCFMFYFCCFEIGFCVIKAELKLRVSLRLALNSWSCWSCRCAPPCLCLDVSCPVSSGVVFCNGVTLAQKDADLGLRGRVPSHRLMWWVTFESWVAFIFFPPSLLRHKQDKLCLVY